MTFLKTYAWCLSNHSWRELRTLYFAARTHFREFRCQPSTTMALSCSECFLSFLLLLVPHLWRNLDRWCLRRICLDEASNKEDDSHKTNDSPTSPENEFETQSETSYLEKSIETIGTDSLTTERDENKEAEERRHHGIEEESQTFVAGSRELRATVAETITTPISIEPFYDDVSNEFSSSQDESNSSMDLNDLMTEHTDLSSPALARQQRQQQQHPQYPMQHHFLSRSDSHITMSSNHSNSAANLMNVSEQLRRKLCVQNKKPTTPGTSCYSPRLSQSMSSRLNHSAHRLDHQTSPKPSILDARRNHVRQQFHQRGIKLLSPTLQRDRRRLRRRLSNFTEL